MSPLAIIATALLVAVCVYALAVLAGIATADPEPEHEPRHLDTGDPGQHRIASTSPHWLREAYEPRHAYVPLAGAR